jgi:hypothetical protein
MPVMDVAAAGHKLATSGLATFWAGFGVVAVAVASVVVVYLTFVRLPGKERKERSDDNSQEESFSAVVAPVLAGFTLAAITALATATSMKPVQPWRDLALSYMIMATGFFLASLQLSAGDLYRSHRKDWSTGRASLTFAGIVLLAAALIVLVAAVADNWWVNVALAVLGLGGLIPMGFQLSHYRRRLKGPASRRSTSSSRPRNRPGQGQEGPLRRRLQPLQTRPVRRPPPWRGGRRAGQVQHPAARPDRFGQDTARQLLGGNAPHRPPRRRADGGSTP